MALNLVDIETVLAEIQPVLTGGWIQKIHQPQDLALTLDVRSPGASVMVYICADPRLARLHFVSKKYANPPTPPPVCQFLRSHLEGGRIEEITQQPGDRLVYIHIRKEGKAYRLVIALLGNRTNVLLLNEKHLLLRSLKESRFQIGERFVPPTTRSSPTSQSTSTWKEGEIEKASQGEGSFAVTYPVSAAMETYYDKKEHEEHQHRLHDQQLAHARKALKMAKRKLRVLQEDLQKSERYREYARYGELMKSALHDLRKGQETATLTDYFEPTLPTLTLPLDPAKDPIRNMEDYFRKYHKYLGAQEHLLPRIERQRQTVVKLEEQLTEIEQGVIDPEFSPKVTKKLQSPPTPRLSKIRPAPAQGYRMYTSADGIAILVGKTAKDNDHLTFKVAKPDDLWLHARGTPGSHVIVRLEKGQTVPHETLKDAATLTLWFSDLRKSGKGEVIYTLRKFVKKAKGQKPGAVHVTRDKSMWIECKDERLERLKGNTL
ncbi:MAG: NFACT RNA binding domain-containing protein [Nitrospirae bacterium]|nr:NFACT RNA binding domain-containing protein [Nitrospirota bacterium]